MRIMILILLLSPLVVFSQNPQVFIKLTDNTGQQIKGEVLMKGYEKSIQAVTITSGGKNNTQLGFTMQVSGASADLKRAMSGGQPLTAGNVYVIVPTQGAGTISYTIKMEQITVLSCAEVMGCNNAMTTTVSLQASRIGWTYYSVNKSGATAVARKYGWDNTTGTEWTNF